MTTRYLHWKPDDIHVLNRYAHGPSTQLILRNDIVRYSIERVDRDATARDFTSIVSPWWILNSQLGPLDVVEETVKESDE